MTNVTTGSGTPRRNGSGLALALTFVSLIGVAAGPAQARDRDRGPAEHRGREVHRGPSPRMHEDYRAYDNGGGYVYAPPAVVYAPAPPSGIDFVFPIEIH